MVLPIPTGYNGGGYIGAMYLFTSVDDALSEGFDESQDIAGECNVHNHISEYFRLGGGRLWVRFSDQDDPMDDVVTKEVAPLLLFAEGKIRTVGIAMNPPTGYVASVTPGIDQQVLDAIEAAVAATTVAAAAGMPVVIILEGHAFDGDPSSVVDLRTYAASHVGVVLAQDGTLASQYPGYAAVGSVLGLIAAASVHQNIGWVGRFNLTGGGRWASTKLGGNAENTYTPQQMSMLLEKGYIIARTFPAYPGVYLAGDPACTAITDDYAMLRYTRTVDKAVRGVRVAMLPYVNSPVYLSPDGRIDEGTCKVLEVVAGKPPAAMQAAGEVSAYDVAIDPDQLVLQTDSIEVAIAVLPVGCASWIKVNISLTTQIS